MVFTSILWINIKIAEELKTNENMKKQQGWPTIKRLPNPCACHLYQCLSRLLDRSTTMKVNKNHMKQTQTNTKTINDKPLLWRLIWIAQSMNTVLTSVCSLIFCHYSEQSPVVSTPFAFLGMVPSRLWPTTGSVMP